MKMNKHTLTVAVALCIASVLAGCAAITSSEPTASTAAPSDADVLAVMKASFAETDSAKLNRLDQTELQAACSLASQTGKPMPDEVREKLQTAAMQSIKYPADGKYLGDWRRGEQIAQSGRGMQFSDPVGTVAGGNCYACHQLDKAELAHGNIGPSLNQYGKLRGQSEAIVKYTWQRIYNTHSLNACANMPRFGDAGILTEAQMKDVMALLLDTESPVNK